MMGDTTVKPDATSRPADIVIETINGVKGVMLLNADKEPVLWMRGEALQNLELRLNMQPMKAFFDGAMKRGEEGAADRQ